MALTCYLGVLLLLVIVEIPFPTLGFLPTHPRSARYSNSRPSALHVVDLTDSTTTAEVTLQSLRGTLRRLRADLRTDTKLRESEAPTSRADRNLSPDELARETLLSTRIPNLALCHTRVGPSTIPGAGRGLFATHNVAKGDLITCYPGDALLYTPPGEDEDGEGMDEIVIWGEHVDEVDCWDEDAVFDGSVEGEEGGGRPLTDYAIEVCELYTVLALPVLDNDPAYAGHYANDGAGHFAIDSGAMSVGVEEGIAAYVHESIELANAQNRVLEDSHMVTIATRDITKGEEILVTYGMDFWMEHSNF